MSYLSTAGKFILNHPKTFVWGPMGALLGTSLLTDKYEDLDYIQHIQDKNARTHYLQSGLIQSSNGDVYDLSGNLVDKGETFLDRAAKYGIDLSKVKLLQRHLIEKGLLKEGEDDGLFGRNTESALLAYKKRLGYDKLIHKTSRDIQSEEEKKYEKGNLWDRFSNGESEGLISDTLNGNKSYRKWSKEHPWYNFAAMGGLYHGIYGGGFNKIIGSTYKHAVPKNILSKLRTSTLNTIEKKLLNQVLKSSGKKLGDTAARKGVNIAAKKIVNTAAQDAAKKALMSGATKAAAKTAAKKAALKVGTQLAVKAGAKFIPFAGGVIALADAGNDIYKIYRDWDKLSKWGVAGHAASALMNGAWAIGSFAGLKHGGKFNKSELVKSKIYYLE